MPRKRSKGASDSSGALLISVKMVQNAFGMRNRNPNNESRFLVAKNKNIGFFAKNVDNKEWAC